ncbi:MAG: GWxTD domain-containing protein, partial [Vicinamibacteria bacterium]
MLFIPLRTPTLASVGLVALLGTLSSFAEAEKKLSKSDKRWLEREVAAVITEEEIEIFKELDSGKDRKLFKELFWVRRDPSPMTLENEIKEEIERRMVTANRQFRERGLKGSVTDRGKIFLVLGSPDETDSSRPGAPGQAEISVAPASGPAGADPTDSVLSTFTPSLVGLAEVITWTYEPQLEMGIPEGLTVEFERQRGSRYRLRRPGEVDEALESVKSIYIANPAITYARDEEGRLMRPPSRLDPHSPAKKVLREMIEKKTETAAIPFETETAFFRAEDGSVYVPMLFEIDAQRLRWDRDTSEVTLFGAVEQLGTLLHHFEEQVTLTRTEDGRAVFEMPFELPPGNYTFNLGIIDDKSHKVGARRVRVEVPNLHVEGLVISSVLTYGEKHRVQEPPGTPGHAFQFGQVQFRPMRGRTYETTDNIGIVFFVYGFGSNDQGQPSLTGR